jgi:penicillin-binding protein 2
VYSDSKGLSIIHKYAEKFGFNSLSGVEIQESMPEISNTDAIRTSIGYYHNFAPVHMAKYITTIANGGTCYNLTLIDSVKTKDGETVYEQEPSVYYKLDEVSSKSWDAVHYGMRKVVLYSLPSVFPNLWQ